MNKLELGNKELAEFMEIPKCDRCPDCGNYKLGAGLYYTPAQMRYDSSWDWLMPVIERVNKISSETSQIHFYLSGINLKNTWSAVVQWVQEYRESEELIEAILNLYRTCDVFDSDSNELVNSSIELKQIDSDDIWEDFCLWLEANTDLKKLDVYEGAIFDFKEHWNNGLTHTQNLSHFEEFLKE